jgi:photosystem II stability/assembly factor-like uncharacterized protein
MMKTGTLSQFTRDETGMDKRGRFVKSILELGGRYPAMKRGSFLECLVVAGVMLVLATTSALCFDTGTFSRTVANGRETPMRGMSWETLGPPGGSVSQIVYHPTVEGLVYMSAGDLWFSIDGGRMWYNVPDMHGVRGRILIDPFRPNVILVGTGGFFMRSANYGLTWEAVIEAAVDSDTFDPAHPGLVYMSTAGWPDKSNQYAHFYRSTDHGKTWTTMYAAGSGSGLGFIYYWTILRPSPIDGSIFALTGWSDGVGGTWKRVCRSTNGGASWIYDDTGLPGFTTSDMEYIFPNVLAACTVDGFYAHLNGGNQWHSVPNEMSGRYTVGLSAGPAENIWYLVEGFPGGDVIHRSTDWGVSWTELLMMSGQYDIGPVAADPHAEPGTETIMVGVPEAGIFATTDFGQNWEQRADGLPPVATQSLDFGPAGSGLLMSWELANTGIPRGEVLSLCAHPADDRIVFAARGEVFRSTDQGETWMQVSSGFTDTWCVAINPGNPDIVFAGTKELGLYKSTDGGDSWFFSGEGMTGSSVRDITVDPLDPLHIFAANGGAGVYESEDGGASWNLVLVGEPSSRFISVTVAAGGELVYAGPNNYRHLWRSTDGGDTWEIVLTNVVANDIVIPDSSPLAVAIGGDDATRAWGSLDGGNTWFVLEGYLSTFYVNDLAVPPQGEGFLYAATKTGIQRFLPND